MATTAPIGPDTLISVKITIEGSNRKFKIPLRDLAPPFLCDKLRQLLEIPWNQTAVFERYSDSAGKYITLDPANPTAFKSLIRAAKAKHKLRLRTVFPADSNGRPPVATPEFPYTDKLTFPNGSQQTLVNNPAAVQPISLPFRNMDFWLNHPEGVKKAEGSKITKPTIGTPPVCARAPTSAPPKRSHVPLGANNLYTDINRLHRQLELYVGPAPVPSEAKVPIPASWSVFCNACDQPMENEHFHCNVCDDGDYDLCKLCVEKGVHCRGVDHWLIKRSIENGRVVSSQTSILLPKQEVKSEVKLPKVTSIPDMPGAFTDDKKVELDDGVNEESSRTCNSCIEVFPDNQFVTCLDCDDFDLCLKCHEDVPHGHHPAHTFEPVGKRSSLSSLATFMCAPGRNARHAALCDGCDKPIFGVRHKCLNCADWDYCSDCYKNVAFIHAGHRFVPIYEPIAEPRLNHSRHVGIYCDGPLCKDKHEYIVGLRYKCAICDDTDFCASCETSPENRHNRTHPVIMFKTPVRNVSITTLGDAQNGEPLRTMGDQPDHAAVSSPNHAASQVQTIVDLKPSEPSVPITNKIEIKDLLAEPIEEKIKVDEVFKPITAPIMVKPSELSAQYVCDTIVDGSIMVPNQRFVQVWTIKNNGPRTWPAGCSVRCVGGDNMLDVHDTHPTSTSAVQAARESNIINRPVEVGETVLFSIPMKAPNRQGTKISYWRLKTAEGLPFGHRLWCHIKVVAPVPVFSGLQEGVFPTRYPAMTSNLSDACKAMQARSLAANVGLEAAKIATADRDSQRIRDSTAAISQAAYNHDSTEIREPASIHKRVMCVERTQDVQTRMARFRRDRVRGVASSRVGESTSCVELPVERSAVELGLAPQAELSSKDKRKSRLIDIPVTYSNEKEMTKVPQAASVEAVDDSESAASGSTMIFPTLEKESPSASVHQDQAQEDQEAPQSTAPIVSAVTSPAPTTATIELFDDAESVDILDSSDDEAFMTDEEYDLLDASDEEFA